MDTPPPPEEGTTRGSDSFGVPGLAETWYRFRRPVQFGTIAAGLILGIVWSWTPGFIVVGLSVVAHLETNVQLGRAAPSMFASILLDATLIGAGVFFVRVPHLAVPVPFLANAAVALMLLPVTRAVWVWVHSFVLMMTILGASTHSGMPPMAGAQGALVAFLTILIFSGQLLSLIWLLERAVRRNHHSRIAGLTQGIQDRDDFIASISHELRTPLTAIVGYAHLLGEDTTTLFSGGTRGMIEVIRDESIGVSDLVEDLVTQARVGSGSMALTLTEVPLLDVAAEALRACQAATPMGNVSIEGDPAIALADPMRVKQILRNLITNAVRYGGPQITIRVSQGSDRGVEVVVMDDGPGIPPSEVERVFRPYETVGPEPCLPGRLGLGLPISQRLAEMMGGELTYLRCDHLTSFRLQLPRAQGVDQQNLEYAAS